MGKNNIKIRSKYTRSPCPVLFSKLLVLCLPRCLLRHTCQIMGQSTLLELRVYVHDAVFSEHGAQKNVALNSWQASKYMYITAMLTLCIHLVWCPTSFSYMNTDSPVIPNM